MYRYEDIDNGSSLKVAPWHLALYRKFSQLSYDDCWNSYVSDIAKILFNQVCSLTWTKGNTWTGECLHHLWIYISLFLVSSYNNFIGSFVILFIVHLVAAFIYFSSYNHDFWGCWILKLINVYCFINWLRLGAVRMHFQMENIIYVVLFYDTEL